MLRTVVTSVPNDERCRTMELNYGATLLSILARLGDSAACAYKRCGPLIVGKRPRLARRTLDDWRGMVRETRHRHYSAECTGTRVARGGVGNVVHRHADGGAAGIQHAERQQHRPRHTRALRL